MTESSHSYDVTLAWPRDNLGLLSAPPRPDLVGGAPPQFGGSDSVWSPEHLLLSSASLCLMLTFVDLCRREGVQVDDYRSQTHGTLGRTDLGMAFTRIDIRVALRAVDMPRAESLLLKAKSQCIISNSLRAPVEIEIVRGARAALGETLALQAA